MTALVTKHLPLVSGAPDGIKKLRALILELAMRGKLVPHDHCESPVGDLLARISLVRNSSSPKGKGRKGAPIEHGLEPRFDAPAGWQWVRLGDLLTKIGAGSTPLGGKQAYVASGVKFLRSQNVWNEGLRLDEVALISEETHQKMSGTHVAAGDILFNITGASIGRCAIVPDSFDAGNVSQHVTIIRPCIPDICSYLHKVLMSGLIQDTVMAVQVGVSREGLSIGKLVQFPIPLPPLEEQHRIVAKVDELMALCDRLEADQADAEAAHAQLVQALLDSLTQATDAADFRASWQRLSEHFHTLFTTESSIDALKQTVLQLAVMGRLVQQVDADESALKLLDRIAQDLATTNQSSRSKKSRVIADVESSERYTELPGSWAWTRLGALVRESGAGWSPSCEARQRIGDEWGVLKVSAVSWGEYRAAENKALPANLEARPEHEVKVGDFLVSRANTAELVARSVVVEATPPRLMLSDKIVRLNLTALCNLRFINLVNSAPASRNYYSAIAGGTSSSMKNVSREQILNLPLALPPLEEQNRIVAKVDELMALCDQLKTQLAEVRQQHAQLATVLVEQAIAA